MRGGHRDASRHGPRLSSAPCRVTDQNGCDQPTQALLPPVYQKMIVPGRDLREISDLLAFRHEVAEAVGGQGGVVFVAVASVALVFAAVFVVPALVRTAFFADTPRLVAEVAFLTAMIDPFKVCTLSSPRTRTGGVRSLGPYRAVFNGETSSGLGWSSHEPPG